MSAFPFSLARHLQETDDDAVSDSMSPTELVLAVGLFFITMGVGASCKWQLFKKMFSSPKALRSAAVGILCQFLIMPIMAFVLTKIFGVNGYAALGYIIVGAMPGGSSSNVFTMWGAGVLELSVFMTVVSTLVSFGMTPLWIYAFSTAVDLEDDEGNGSPLALDQIAITLAMLLIPLSIGISFNFCKCADRIRIFIEKTINLLAILIFSAAVVVLAVEYPEALKEHATWQIGASAVLFFPIAAGMSYGITTLLGFSPSAKRTVVMEVGLQNLALGFTIGEAIVTRQSHREQALPFPLLYAMFMYFWAAVLIPVFRRQKRINAENGVVDYDPDFFIEEETTQKEVNGTAESDADVEEGKVQPKQQELEITEKDINNSESTRDDDADVEKPAEDVNA